MIVIGGAIILLCTGLFVIIGVVMKQKEKGGDDMVKQLYVYVVLFATLMMSIGGAIGVFMSVADMISPSATYSQSYTDYKDGMGTYDEKTGKTHQTMSEKELRLSYDTYIQDEEKRTKNQAKNDLIKSFGFILIPLPIFFGFNRMRKTKEEVA